MALPWPHPAPPHAAPTLPVPTIRPASRARSLPARARLSARSLTGAVPDLPRVRAIATAPTTALITMLVGLVLLFVLPPIGLPFVALVVLPAVAFHLRADRRAGLRLRR